jgi:hypothetical protein
MLMGILFWISGESVTVSILPKYTSYKVLMPVGLEYNHIFESVKMS